MILTIPDDQLTGSLCQERPDRWTQDSEEIRRTQRQMGEMAGPFPLWVHLKSIWHVICLSLSYCPMNGYFTFIQIQMQHPSILVPQVLVLHILRWNVDSTKINHLQTNHVGIVCVSSQPEVCPPISEIVISHGLCMLYCFNTKHLVPTERADAC